MKKPIPFILMIFFAVCSFAQEKQLISSAGMSVNTSNYIIDFAIGETIIGDYNGDNISFFNGILFSENKISTSNSSQKESSLKLYPNPVDDVMIIDGIDIADVNNVKVYDLTGKLVKNLKIKTNQIEVKNIPQGVYILIIQTENLTYQEKIIKK
ncbi:T9SS type A sorting domain-containing protein [Carboxylicivirga caseinilyticus]|uniref:T9SS type A sorting domain-containing protein n=1 Tax=Carboxylicivirga caseinilyticus TaxID=3417572 RepID=UPI003D33EC7C|nr:T9SS type A sorting domain-containing protein [Marinilabiliaceae bacterium A049]